MLLPDIRDYLGQRIHLVGIGGSSMSGLAEMLAARGYAVTGSDNAQSHTVERLRAAGIPVTVGHTAAAAAGAGLLVYSAAISPDNPERKEALRAGIPEMERAVLLGQLMRGYEQVACVSGAHGKTTATSMLAQILLDCGMDPTAHIGGSLDSLGGGTRIGGGGTFVAEACEFHGSFLQFCPTVAIVLNIDADHLDYYGDIEHITEAFFNFLSLLPENGLAIGWGEDPRVSALLARLPHRSETFGMTDACSWYPAGLAYSDTGCPSFTACYQGREVCHTALRVAGAFNTLNALAALAAAHALGADMQKAGESLSAFVGARRRFERTGHINGAVMYHDYGHNPVEMRGALSVARMQRPCRVIAVMQPHTFSRVKTLFGDYLDCTRDADITLVTDIYAARERDPGDINSGMLVDGMRANGIDARWTPTFGDTEEKLLALIGPGDLVITMGCGNINLLNEIMQAHADAVLPESGSALPR
jgi:UDP-N-acetylmuramate--alanine ligase